MDLKSQGYMGAPSLGDMIDSSLSTHYSKELEAAARARGFKSAEEMVLWDKQRSIKRTSVVEGGKGTQTPPANNQQNPGPAGGLFGWVDKVMQALKPSGN